MTPRVPKHVAGKHYFYEPLFSVVNLLLFIGLHSGIHKVKI